MSSEDAKGFYFILGNIKEAIIDGMELLKFKAFLK
jgi:hypothetical protein